MSVVSADLRLGMVSRGLDVREVGGEALEVARGRDFSHQISSRG